MQISRRWLLYFLGFLYCHFFQKNTKRKNKTKKSGTKRHFYLTYDNFLKKKALDKFTFAWGGAKGFSWKSIKTNKMHYLDKWATKGTSTVTQLWLTPPSVTKLRGTPSRLPSEVALASDMIWMNSELWKVPLIGSKTTLVLEKSANGKKPSPSRRLFSGSSINFPHLADPPACITFWASFREEIDASLFLVPVTP